MYILYVYIICIYYIWIFASLAVPTWPGITTPTAGEISMGASLGTTNSNDVAPTSATGPRPMRGTSWVNSLLLVCELITDKHVVDESPTEVARNEMTDWDKSNGA